MKFEPEAHKHLLRRLRDLELHTMHTPHALHFCTCPNPQRQTSDPCTCIFLVVDVENRAETPKTVFPKLSPHCFFLQRILSKKPASRILALFS